MHLRFLVALSCSLPALPAQSADADFYRAQVFGQMPWLELGPVAFGGRIVDLEVHPQNAAVWWAASASGGLWKTENNGISFAPQFQDQYCCSIGDLAVACSAPDTLYLGTGESNNQRSSYWGNGVYKSTDGGKSWRHVGLQGSEHIGRIAVHPQNPDIVFVAAAGALYTPNEARGLYRSLDGGNSWDKVKDLGHDVGFIDVAILPGSPDTVLASSYQRRRRAWNFDEGGEGSRLWRSTDGGATWTQLEDGLPRGNLGRIGIGVCAGDGNVVYAAIENLNPMPPRPEPARAEGAGDEGANRPPRAAAAAAGVEAEAEAEPTGEQLADPLFLAAQAEEREEAAREAGESEQDPQERERPSRRREIGGEVYRSDDGGSSWHQVSGQARVGGEPHYYYGQVHVDPQDKDTVYVLGVNVHVSRDGGRKWSSGGRSSFARGLHVDHHALWIDPRDSGHLLLGNDGGLAVTWDGGKNWDHVARLPIAQYYAIAVDDRVPYRVYGGLQDNGTWGFPVQGASTDGIAASDAFRIDGGDGFYVCIDRDDPDVVYSESQFGGMSRQNLRTGERRGIKPQADKGSPPLRFNWMTPIVLSPHNAQTVYTGSQYLHRSRNRGDAWQVISPDLTGSDPDKLKGDVPHCTITTIAESPLQEGLLWVGTDDGRLWSSRDGGLHWQRLDDRLPAAAQGLWIARVEASPFARDTAFVAVTGYREDRREPLLFRTDDGGDSFLQITRGLPQEPINVVRQHPRNSHCLLCGTEMGVYVSVDDGAAWYPLGKDLPRVAVHDLLVHPGTGNVLVGTHGRGIWVLDGKALEQLDSGALAAAFRVLPPSDGVMLPRAFSRGYTGARQWAAANPFTTATFRFYLAEDGDEEVEIEVLDAEGKSLWQQKVEPTAGYHEVAWTQPRGQGRGFGGGQFPGFGGRGRFSGQRPGQFAVRLQKGQRSEVLAFAVHDRRPRGGLSPVPGVGGAGLGERELEQLAAMAAAGELSDEELEELFESGALGGEVEAGEREQEREREQRRERSR